MTAEQQYHAAVILSEGLKQNAVAEAQRAYTEGEAALHRSRPAHAGTAEAAAYAPTEHERLTELHRTRDDAIRTAEGQHRDRAAAAGARYGIVNFSPGNPSAPHAVEWLAALDVQ